MARWRRNFEDELDEPNEAAFEAALCRPRKRPAIRRALVLLKTARARAFASAVAKTAPQLLAGRTLRAIEKIAAFVEPGALANWNGRRFSSLVTHLFERFPTAPIFWTGFFDMNSVFARMAIHAGAGGSTFDFAKRELPIPLTRAMCHALVDAPPRFGKLERAIRHTQVVTLGGDAELARLWPAILWLATPEVERFRVHLLGWLIRTRPDTASVRPIVDWAFARHRGDKSFSMKGRSVHATLEATLAWHNELRERRTHADHAPFSASGLLPMTHEAMSIEEIRTLDVLFDESTHLGHCAYGYRSKIQTGQCSVWHIMERSFPRLTIEVRDRRVVQARGRFNRLPHPEEIELLMKWAHANTLSVVTF